MNICDLNPFYLASLVVFLLPALATVRFPNIIRTTKAGATTAIGQIADWAKWMAAIQTTTLGGFSVLLFKDHSHGLGHLSYCEKFLSITGLFCLGSAIFISAWILGAIPSLTMRVQGRDGEGPDERFDIYEQRLFARIDRPKFGYALSLNHWYWGTGLAAVGLYVCAQY